MNENRPENVFALLSYLNREQYGDRPLFLGQNYNSPLDREAMRNKKGSPVRIKKDDEYKRFDNRQYRFKHYVRKD